MRKLRRAALAASLTLQAAGALAQDASRGESLYHQNCVPCHGFPPLGGPQNASNNPEMIRNAIDSRVARMRFLSYLTDRDLADIAAFIARTVDPKPLHDYSGLWFDPAESGWGLKISQHPRTGHGIFAMLFVYEAPGKPMWFALPAGRWSTPTTYGGAIYRVAGPSVTQPFDAAKIGVREAGALTFTFHNENAATITGTVDGAAFSKRVTRLRF